MKGRSEAEQTLWRRLSVFAGDFSLGAAEAVCSGGAVEKTGVAPLLSQLVERSLVVEEQGSEDRYRVPEPLRSEPREQLAVSGEADFLHGRLTDYLWELSRETDWLSIRRAKSLCRWEQEHENLRAVLRWLVGRGAAERGLQLAGALWGFWLRRHRDEGRQWFAMFLALPQVAGRTATRARALDHAASIALYQLDYIAAQGMGEESLSILREVGDPAAVANSTLHLGTIVWSGEHNHAMASSLFEESLAICRELDDAAGIAGSLLRLGSLSLAVGDYAAARTQFKESLERFRKLGHLRPVIVLLDYSACLAAGLGQPERALHLAGAASKHREGLDFQFPPGSEVPIERRLEPARNALDEAAQATAWAEGRAMTLEEALAYALDDPGRDAAANTPF